MAERRLADVQALGRAGKVQLFGNGNEVTQVAKFHSLIYSGYDRRFKYILDRFNAQS
jgi:hypothetical protein